MRSGAVPFLVTYPYRNNRTVTHVQWDDDKLALIATDCTFTDDVIREVDVVVDGVESCTGYSKDTATTIPLTDTEVFSDTSGNFLAVSTGKFLTNPHIVEIVIAKLPGEVA